VVAESLDFVLRVVSLRKVGVGVWRVVCLIDLVAMLFEHGEFFEWRSLSEGGHFVT
jgi:hypothetical protein